MKFDIGLFFDALSRQFKHHYSLERLTGALHKDVWTFMKIPRSVLLRMKIFQTNL